MTGHFDVIGASSPHIYHSALVLAPKKSIVWRLYESYAHPFVRVVQGVQTSWDTNTAATTRSSRIKQAVWSPCSRFIAITCGGTTAVDVLDPVTLQQLQTLELQPTVHTSSSVVIFSPDSHILTSSGCLFGDQEVLIVSWDLQTGGIVSAIKHPFQEHDAHSVYSLQSITYSENGKMVGVLHHSGCEDISAFGISIFNIVSGIHMHSLVLDRNHRLLGDIWTQGEALSFATFLEATTTIIWEVNFTSSATPVEVGRLSTQMHNIDHPECIEPIPMSLNQFVLILSDGFLVWDSQTSRPLLHCTDTSFFPMITFSSNGHFLAYSTKSKIYLWKESPTDYILHVVLPCYGSSSRPLLSPNGESIIAFGGYTMLLWQTKGFATAPPRLLTQDTQPTNIFLLDFSPDGVLAVVARQKDNMVKVLDLNSGVLQLTIDVDMKVYGLQVTRDTVIVVGTSKVIAWILPTGDCIPNIQMGLEDSSWTTNLNDPPGEDDYVHGASISPDSSQIAFMMQTPSDFLLSVYSASTGVYLACTKTYGVMPWFSPEGHNIWVVGREGPQQKYVQGVDHKLHQAHDKQPQEAHPWASSHGYQVTKDWWVLNPDGKRLLMLPPPWRSSSLLRVWKGQFLVLLHGALPEPIILDLKVTQ